MVRGAIVYLTQARHSSYKGRDSQANLRLSVRLLYQNYNAKHRDDVLFFHSGDVTPVQQQAVLSLCVAGTAQFYELPSRHFELPAAHRNWIKQAQWKYIRKFSVGYRHMIRFFAIDLWETVERLGYDYVMRLDEDSYIWSSIDYSMFGRMDARGLEYVYRLASWERGHVQQNRDGFHQLVREYALQHQLDLRWLLGSCDLVNASSTLERTRRFSTENCGSMYCIYNNFFAAKVSFWRRPDVAYFLRFAGESGTIYTQRYGDALWHSVALALFMEPKRLSMLDDFAYEHATIAHTTESLPNVLSRHYCRRDTGQVTLQVRRETKNGTELVHGRACDSESMDDPKGCLKYGGIALASADASSQPAAVSRMSNLSLALLHCPELDILHRSTCLYSPGQRLQALLSQWVTLEQIDCTREPRPFHCDARSFNRSAFIHFADELRQLKTSAAALQIAQSRKHAERTERVLQQNIDQLFQQRQQRAHCSNWCHSPTFPTLPTRREQACHRRADGMFIKLASRMAPDASMSTLVLSPPPPSPPQRLRKGHHYSRWWQRQQGARAPPADNDTERWRFADRYPAPGNV